MSHSASIQGLSRLYTYRATQFKNFSYLCRKLIQNIMLINYENLEKLKQQFVNVRKHGWRDAEIREQYISEKIRLFEAYLQHKPEQISVENKHQYSNTRDYDKTYVQQLEEKRYLRDGYNYVTSSSYNKSY